ncbi:MAG: radical SAM protein, partial [Paramuribaculum sp.]|nr:radical SAM protein [Paramuribaculum sp.]
MAGIYVHIPFCHSKCAYCDFYSMPLRNEADFVDSLTNEYSSRKKELTEDVSTIYLGGGTPSCLSRKQLTRIFELLPVDNTEEITIEINPEDATEDFIQWLHKSTPVNRISMGVQSLNDNELKTIGRRHSAIEAVEAANRLLDCGFNLSLDLIYGLPGQDTVSWKKSLEGILN